MLLRTLYRRVEAGWLKTRMENGVTLVDPAAVQGLLAVREAAKGGAVTGNRAGNGNRGNAPFASEPDGPVPSWLPSRPSRRTPRRSTSSRHQQLAPATVLRLWRE